MWPDNETDQDLLGFAIHADLLRAILADPRMLPVTVGLFGDWGGGKSSILKMLQHDLDHDDEFAVIYFNSWVFEGYEDAKTAILSTLLKELRDHRKVGSKIGDEVTALLKRVNWMRALKLGAAAGLAFLTANPLPLLIAGGTLPLEQLVKRQGEAKEKQETAELDFGGLLKPSQESVETVRSFRADFQKLIEKTNLRALIILIDDLDRCSPERLIENLEAIKLFLNVDRTAFVVAADRRIVENAIRIRYSALFIGEGGNATNESLVTDYLEKLIQVPYTLPKLAPYEVRSYLSMLFLKKYLPQPKFEEVLGKYRQLLSKDRYAAFQLGDELDSIEQGATRVAVAESMRLVEACSDAITDGLKGNPRQLKRFLNAFWLRKELANIAHIVNLKDHVFIKLMVLEYISAERFEELYNWHRSSSYGFAEPLAELEAAERPDAILEAYANWRTQRLWRWLKAEPGLANEDLRDYFWVARSSLTATLSGIRLITQATRTCGQELLSTVEVERRRGVEMFASLSDDEQAGVLGIVMQNALQNPQSDTALRSLIDLSRAGHVNAAETFSRCVDRIGPSRLSPGFGVTLRALKAISGNRAVERVLKIREELSATDTTIAKALKLRRSSSK